MIVIVGVGAKENIITINDDDNDDNDDDDDEYEFDKHSNKDFHCKVTQYRCISVTSRNTL